MSNKQKTIILIVALVVVIGLIIWSVQPKQEPESQNNSETPAQLQEKARESLLGASFIMPDNKEVRTFENGVAEFTRGTTKIRAELGNVKPVKVKTGEGERTDLLSIITISYNEGKPIQYLGMYTEQEDGTLVMKSIALIAEDAKVGAVTTQELAGDDNEEYLIEVDYSITSGEEAFESKKNFVVQSGAFNLSKTEVVEHGKD